MKINHNGKIYEINDSNFHGPVPRGAYAIAFAVHKAYKGVRWGISDYTYTNHWIVLQSAFSHESDDFDVYYKWDIVKVFGETELELAKSFKNTLTDVAKLITITS